MFTSSHAVAPFPRRKKSCSQVSLSKDFATLAHICQKHRQPGCPGPPPLPLAAGCPPPPGALFLSEGAGRTAGISAGRSRSSVCGALMRSLSRFCRTAFILPHSSNSPKPQLQSRSRHGTCLFLFSGSLLRAAICLQLTAPPQTATRAGSQSGSAHGSFRTQAQSKPRTGIAPLKTPSVLISPTENRSPRHARSQVLLSSNTPTFYAG